MTIAGVCNNSFVKDFRVERETCMKSRFQSYVLEFLILSRNSYLLSRLLESCQQLNLYRGVVLKYVTLGRMLYADVRIIDFLYISISKGRFSPTFQVLRIRKNLKFYLEDRNPKTGYLVACQVVSDVSEAAVEN